MQFNPLIRETIEAHKRERKRVPRDRTVTRRLAAKRDRDARMREWDMGMEYSLCGEIGHRQRNCPSNAKT